MNQGPFEMNQIQLKKNLNRIQPACASPYVLRTEIETGYTGPQDNAMGIGRLLHSYLLQQSNCSRSSRYSDPVLIYFGKFSEMAPTTAAAEVLPPPGGLEGQHKAIFTPDAVSFLTDCYSHFKHDIQSVSKV